VSSARAAIAGVLATGLVLLMVFPSDQLREPERAFAAAAMLLGIIALLVGVDVASIVRGKRDDTEDS
jgi:hypothetical protein